MARLQPVDRVATHRLIPEQYVNQEDSVLKTLTLSEQAIADLTELDGATDGLTVGERRGIAGIGQAELLAGVPEAHVVNAAFCYPGPYGSRFNDASRGAWYAGFEIDTTLAEVAYHKRRFLLEGRIQGPSAYRYVDFLADFSGSFHFLDATEQRACLQAEPVPHCYRTSQALANKLLFEGSNGIIYPSVRRLSGTCIACFRPALVHHPRRGNHYRINIDASRDSFEATIVSTRPTAVDPRS